MRNRDSNDTIEGDITMSTMAPVRLRTLAMQTQYTFTPGARLGDLLDDAQMLLRAVATIAEDVSCEINDQRRSADRSVGASFLAQIAADLVDEVNLVWSREEEAKEVPKAKASSKKGKVHIGRRAATAPDTDIAVPHNRVKDLPLPEGRADHVLEVMGILTRDGRVRPTMRPNAAGRRSATCAASLGARRRSASHSKAWTAHA